MSVFDGFKKSKNPHWQNLYAINDKIGEMILAGKNISDYFELAEKEIREEVEVDLIDRFRKQAPSFLKLYEVSKEIISNKISEFPPELKQQIKEILKLYLRKNKESFEIPSDLDKLETEIGGRVIFLSQIKQELDKLERKPSSFFEFDKAA